MKKIFVAALFCAMTVFLCACGPCEVHEFGAWEVVQEPTCTAEGKQVRRCVECKTEEESTIPIAAHIMGEWTVDSKPSCTEKGQQTRICVNCTFTEQDEITALKHDFTNWTTVTEATCTESGNSVRKCKSCNLEENKSLPLVKHSYEKFVCTMCQAEQYMFCETGAFYEGPDGLSVKVNSFTKTERVGYILYRLNYSLKNDV